MENYYWHEFQDFSPKFPILTLVWQEKGLTRLIFGGKNQISKDNKLARNRFKDCSYEPRDFHKDSLSNWAFEYLSNYFSNKNLKNKPASKRLKMDLGGTDFQNEVWQRIRTIPFGKTLSYGDLAFQISRPKSSRAVGRATGANPLPIFIPCHRVIGSQGDLVGFTGGLPIKECLLKHEGILAI